LSFNPGTGLGRRNAGTNIRVPIEGDKTFETHAHATIKSVLTGGAQYCCERLAGISHDGFTVNADLECCAALNALLKTQDIYSCGYRAVPAGNNRSVC
jgi:hypothetical protein